MIASRPLPTKVEVMKLWKYKDESGAVLYVSEKRKTFCHTKVSPYLLSVLQQLKNRIWEARFDGQKAESILRACCRADYDTDGVNNRKCDVWACTFVHLFTRCNTEQQAGDEGFSSAAGVLREWTDTDEVRASEMLRGQKPAELYLLI